MKKILIAAVMCIWAAGAFAMDLTSEMSEIVKTVEYYIDGGRKGSGDTMKKAFHPAATIYSKNGGGPIQLLFDMVEGKPAKDIPYTISAVDIKEDIAMVRIEIDSWLGNKYTDMFTMIKTDGEWKIISKVSYTHPK